MVAEKDNNSSLKSIAGEDNPVEKEVYSNAYLHAHIRPLEEVEKEAIETAIELCKGNIPKAAVFLDIAPSTIYRKLKQWEKSLAKQTIDE